MKTISRAALIAALAAMPVPVLAQENTAAGRAQDEDTVQLAPVDVVETRAPAPAYTGYDPVDSGASTVGEEAIQAHQNGSGDPMDMLRLIPNIRFDADYESVDRADLQDLRPSDISIAGGRPFENLFRLDGVRVTNIMDTTNTAVNDMNETVGAGNQSVFIDPALIGALTVRDSNVSARYGDFSGGVVEVDVRDPGDTYAATLTFGYENDGFVEYIYDDSVDAEGADTPPTFERWRLHGTVDMPVTENFSLLVGLGRSRSRVDYAVHENYGGGYRGSRSTSDNVLVKGIYDFSDTLSLTSSVTYSPYESEFSQSNSADSLTVSQGGGLTLRSELAGATGETDWSVSVAYLDADMSRDAPPAHTNFPTAAPSVDYCTGRTSCSRGGFGDLEQYQRDLQFEADFTRPFLGGTLSGGGEFSHTEAHKARLEDVFYYTMSSGVDANTICADPEDVACIDGEVALRQRIELSQFDATVELNQTSAWVEDERSFGPLTLRSGLRWTHDDFLDNHDVAGRLTAVWEFREDWTLTGGLNRYYAGDFVGYAIRETYPDLVIYRRDATISGSDIVFSPDDWEVYRLTRPARYRQAGLSTPYSDEATLALTFPAWIGVGRVKAVQRWHRDQIIGQPRVSVEESDEDGAPYTRSVYYPTNAGKTDYIGASAEWSASWRNHAITFNANWSETRNNSEFFSDYFDQLDYEDMLGDLVIYNDAIISLAELQAIANQSNFATPFTANASLVSHWFNDALTTTLWLNWRGEYDTLADTGVNETRDGTRYDVYDVVTRDPYLETDLNIDYLFPQTGYGRLGMEVRISNLFNELPHTSFSADDPWQRGRSVWLGVNYTY